MNISSAASCDSAGEPARRWSTGEHRPVPGVKVHPLSYSPAVLDTTTAGTGTATTKNGQSAQQMSTFEKKKTQRDCLVSLMFVNTEVTG